MMLRCISYEILGRFLTYLVELSHGDVVSINACFVQSNRTHASDNAIN